MGRGEAISLFTRMKLQLENSAAILRRQGLVAEADGLTRELAAISDSPDDCREHILAMTKLVHLTYNWLKRCKAEPELRRAGLEIKFPPTIPGSRN